jgi:hypothetical protein
VFDFERIQLTIDSPLNEILIGLMLGEGHIQNSNLISNSRFIYGQSSIRANHLNYFHHIFKLFKHFISKKYQIKSRPFFS